MSKHWLQESLGGNAKTSLVIAVANAVQHSEETLQSLQFGSRAMRVQTQAVVNECIDFKVLCHYLSPISLTSAFLTSMSHLGACAELLEAHTSLGSMHIVVLQPTVL